MKKMVAWKVIGNLSYLMQFLQFFINKRFEKKSKIMGDFFD